VSTPQFKGWREQLDQAWPAVNASSLLTVEKTAWQAEGLSAPSGDEACALAAAGWMARYGQSLALNLPISRQVTLPKLAFYLHRLRYDAAQGLVSSPWLNRVTMGTRKDLLVFGRPRRMLREFVTSTVMHPIVVDLARPLPTVEFQRTLLVNAHGDLLSLVHMLQSSSKPFAIVVVTPVQGCADHTCTLISLLPSFFPGVPIVALGHTGQVLDRPLPIHAWNARLGDYVPNSSPRPPNATAVEVVAARDPVMNALAQKLGCMVWDLKQQLAQTGGDNMQEFCALLAIDRAFRAMNVPLAVHEQGTLRRSRGGRFPIRTIEAWLEIARLIKGQRGDIQAQMDEVLSLIRQAVSDLKDATPGRSEALLNLVSQGIEKNERVAILVGNGREADILQGWLDEKLGAVAIERVSVVFMDGSTAAAPDPVKLAIYAAPLFASRLHWLGLTAARKVVLCHPFEHSQVLAQVDRWWKSNALPSAGFGDKRRLWALDWSGNEPLKDLLVEPFLASQCFVTYKEMACEGHYPKPPRVQVLDALRNYDTWLQALLAEAGLGKEEPSDENVSIDETQDVVLIYLDGEAEPLRWPANGRIMRLEKDTFNLCPARDLQNGDDLVLLGNSEQRVATQQELFDMFTQNHHGLQQTLRVAEKWQELVDAGIKKKKTVADLFRYLKTKKYDVVQGTVQNWAAGGVIGPQDPAAIRLLAELANFPSADKMAAMVENAIVAIRNEHRRIGGELRKAIALSRSRDVSAVQIGARRFSREVFDAMVQVRHVTSIERPSPGAVPRMVKTLDDVASAFASAHPDKIVFTPACERSMDRSSYENLAAFEKILKVMIQGFYPMYAKNSVTLQDVEAMLAQVPSSYAGGMSEITKGMYESHYYKTYNGQSVDISRHIKLGRFHDQRYTLRLYFHWDADSARLVVHHAGEHLPTLNG
jgi:hypothetical protein